MSPEAASNVIKATGDLFPKVPGMETDKGVAMNPPPAEILGTVNRMVEDAVKGIPAGSRGALVGIATKSAGGALNVNLAVVKKVRQNVTVISWVGKSWGQPVEGGAAVQVVF